VGLSVGTHWLHQDSLAAWALDMPMDASALAVVQDMQLHVQVA
jgi:hypothetical protein